MLEKDLNTIIRKSFSNQGDFAFKIQDSGQYIEGKVTHQQNPYDGYAYYKGYFIAWEGKFLSKPQSFNLKDIREHQILNLKLTRDTLKHSIALLLLGVRWSPKQTRVYIFTDLDTIEERREEKRNILKKELETLDNYVLVKKGEIDIEELLKKGGITL